MYLYQLLYLDLHFWRETNSHHGGERFHLVLVERHPGPEARTPGHPLAIPKASAAPLPQT